MGPTKVNQRGGGVESDICSIETWVLKMKYASSTYRDHAADAIETAFQQLLDHNRIQGYTIYEYDLDFFFNCTEGDGTGCRDGNLLKQLQCWRKKNDFTNPGAYLAVHKCDPDDYSSGGLVGASDNVNAWTDPSDCHATHHDSREVDDFEGTAIMEVFHSFVLHKADKVNDMTDGEEHDLGTQFQYSDATDEFTPMVNFSSDAEDGTCNVDDASFTDATTTTLSECSRKAMDYSGDYTFGDNYC